MRHRRRINHFVTHKNKIIQFVTCFGCILRRGCYFVNNDFVVAAATADQNQLRFFSFFVGCIFRTRT